MKAKTAGLAAMPISCPPGVMSARVRWRSSLTMPNTGTGQAEAVEHRLRDGRVLRTAVDQQQIRQRAKARITVEIVLKAARERFVHGAVVVLPVRRADAKLPVVGLSRPAVLKHGHTGDDAAVAEVGDVERLNALGRRVELERALQPFERFEAALRLRRCDEDLLARVVCPPSPSGGTCRRAAARRA